MNAGQTPFFIIRHCDTQKIDPSIAAVVYCIEDAQSFCKEELEANPAQWFEICQRVQTAGSLVKEPVSI